MSFAEWCIKNKVSNWLEMWDYELNEINPGEINWCVGKKYFFKCNRNIHRSELTKISDITSSKAMKYKCRRCSSFGQWCLDNKEFDLLKRWDCSLNKISPFEVTFRSGKKYYFKCPRGIHKSETKRPSNIVKQYGSRRCNACNTFAQWGIDSFGDDFIDNYWSSKNTISPHSISYNTPTKVWIKCVEVDYHDDYIVSAVNFSKNRRCPYCVGKKVAFQDSLGYKHPEIHNIWCDKNKKDPYEYPPMSNKIVWLKCDKHGEYKRKICDTVISEFRCPDCVSEMSTSVLQSKVCEHLISLGYNILHENNCNINPINPKTNYPLRYDNEVPELKLIIEVHGVQHYKITNYTQLAAKYRGVSVKSQFAYEQWKDEYKKYYALFKGYFYLEIPYWTQEDESYKKLINNKINNILDKNNILA